jgi:hypothetical protein
MPSFSVWKRVSIFVYDKPSSATSPAATVLNRNPSTNNNLFYSDLQVSGSVNIAGTAKFTVTNPGNATNAEKSLFSDDVVSVGVAPTQKYIVIVCGHDIIWSGKILRSISTTQSPFNRPSTFGQWQVECESDIGKMKLQEVSPPTPPTVVGKIGEVITSILRRKSSDDIDWTGYHVGSSPALYESVISNEGGTVSYKVQDSDMYTQFMSIAKVSGFEWRTRLVNWVEDYLSWNPSTKVLGAPSVLSRFTLAELVDKWVLFLGDPDKGSHIISYGQVNNTAPVDVIDFDSGTCTTDIPMSTNKWQAQMFHPTKSDISKIGIKLKKTGTPTGTLTFTIETDNANYPSGTLLATSTLDVATLTTSFVEYKVSLPCQLDVGTNYWIVVKGSGSWIVGREPVMRTRANTSAYYRAWGAASWTNHDTNYVYDLRTYYTSITLKNVVNPTLVTPHGETFNGCTFLNGGTYLYTDPANVPPNNSVVVFSNPVPSGVVAGRNYCVIDSTVGGNFRISDTLGGSNISFEHVTTYSTFAIATFHSGRCVFLLDPVVDISWNMEQVMPVNIICANRSANPDAQICYNYNDSTDKKKVATRVTVKGKNIDTTESQTGRSDSISTTLYALNKWEPEATMFENSTVVTQKTDGYIYYCAAASTDLYLIGQDYVIQNGDVIDVWCRWTDGSTPELITNRTVNSVANTTQSDGTKTTKLVINSALSGSKNCGMYSVVSCRRTYVQDYSRLYSSLPSNSIWFGGATSSGKPVYKIITSVGTDTHYGKYIIGIASFDAGVSGVRPILPGCLVSQRRGGETPQAGSPQALFGIISLTETVDQATTLGDLEVYATQALINHSFYLRKGKFQCTIPNFLKPGQRGYGQAYDWQMIKEGDLITVSPIQTFPVGEGIDDKYFDGQYKYRWEVISWTLDCNSMILSVELGDYEPNVNVLINDKTQSLDRTIS